jgi:FAD/FMN-containing dehydrogenase/Fe-S oxidoreductase
MDPAQRKCVHDDLKGIVRGELLFDDLACVLYSTDASIFEVRPAGVVVPHDEEDVQALVRYAGEHELALVPRGAGTGVAGEALGEGLIVDLSKHFRRIVEVGGDTVRVQPGVVYRDLVHALARAGRRFGPDPAGVECTLGGMLATNASGGRALRFGYVRDHVAALRVVLDSGDVAVAERRSRFPSVETSPGRLEDIVSSTATLLQQHAELIRTCRPRTPFNRCGYLLHDVLDAEHIDLPRLLVGSEGTLGVFTEATLRTLPLPAGRALALLGFDSLDSALRAARAALPSAPTACELLDRRLLRLARNETAVAELIPAAVEAVLLIEHEGDSPAEARKTALDLAERLQHGERLARLALVAADDEEIERFWRVRNAALPSLYRLRGGAQPLAFVEDVGVPPETLAIYLHRVQEVLQRHETTASFLVHAATGQVHMRPFLDLRGADSPGKLWALAEEVYALVLELGGTISAQHGTGLARTPWVHRQFGALAPVLRDLKAIFDPRHLFNPGKIVGPPAGILSWPLRRQVPAANGAEADGAPAREWARGDGIAGREGLHEGPVPPEAPAVSVALPTVAVAAAVAEDGPAGQGLNWRPGQVAAEAHSCNGCGECRTEVPGRRMCPIFRATHDEAATPRAKANLMRHLLLPDTDPRLLPSDAVRAVADLCVNCKMCARECPARVNVPKMMLEAKAANVARHGLARGDWVLARTESFAGLGSALAPVVNGLLDNPVARWVLEKVFGLSRRRRLPGFAARSFLRRARRRGWARKPRSARPCVAYFVDVFGNYNDPLLAEAVVAVLHHNGIEVYVPPGQNGCGMAALTYGDVDTAREAVQANLRVLADVAREGFPILCSEPTAALMLRHDALDLVDDPDAAAVAAQTVESTAYLWDLYTQGLLRTDFAALDVSLGHHVPCHVKALGRPPAGPALLSLIPGVRVHTIDVSCSGMAGTYGFKAANYATSLEAGRPMLEELARPRHLFGSTECSACRLQMEDGAGKRTLHPVQYLALAYGLVPELLAHLKQPIRKRVLP